MKKIIQEEATEILYAAVLRKAFSNDGKKILATRSSRNTNQHSLVRALAGARIDWTSGLVLSSSSLSHRILQPPTILSIHSLQSFSRIERKSCFILVFAVRVVIKDTRAFHGYLLKKSFSNIIRQYKKCYNGIASIKSSVK